MGDSEKEGTCAKTPNTISRMRIWSAIIVLVVAVGLSGASWYIHNNWTIVPDLSGRTYDDAIDVLYECGLTGQLALAETNGNLSSADSRVVWQSHEEKSIERVKTKVSFVIDDCFSLNSTPLTQYAYRNVVIDQPQKLEYTCDYRDVSQQMAEQDRFAIKNGIFEGYSIEEPHWRIEIDAADLHYEVYTTSRHGISYSTADAFFSYKIYGEAMAATLEELILSSLERLSGTSQCPNLDKCIVVGKLIPLSGQDTIILRKLNFPNQKNKNSKVFLPQTLVCGEYKFEFSIIDGDSQLYEWYHYVTIIDD